MTTDSRVPTTDVVVAKRTSPYRTVAVVAGGNYVVLGVDYQDPDTDKSYVPDAVVLLGPAGAERLACALRNAAPKARELAQIIAAFIADGGE
jgi:hypothetical protein